MKTNFVAVAACLAAAGACAQTSVQVFGVLDTAVTYTTGSGYGSTHKSQLTNSGNSFSRLGFRGTEDLGGGLAASFWLEAGLQTDNGTGFPTNSNNQASGPAGVGAITFNRRSTVSFSGPFGELRLGRDYTPSFWNTALYDPFGTGGGIGSNHLYFSGFGGLIAPTGTRASNSVGYFLPPNLGGFYGQAMVAMGENDNRSLLPNTLISNRDDGNYAGVRLGWTNGAFNITGATGKTKYATGDLRVSNLGVSYIFESLSGMRLMGEVHTESLGRLDGHGALLGINLPVGAGEIKASYARYKRESMGNMPDPKSEKLALGYVHNFSKRTAVYGTLAYLRNRNGSTQSLAGSITAPNRASRGTEVGIRHNF